jgi:hypothetical protein
MMNRNRTVILYARTCQLGLKRTENACLRYPAPRDENPVKGDGLRIFAEIPAASQVVLD